MSEEKKCKIHINISFDPENNIVKIQKVKNLPHTTSSQI
jgi:exosome complex RNA-binding protein Rrp42 (RNase PH superfamily)